MAEEAIACMVPALVYLFLLGISPLIINYVFPKIPALQKWIDSLPDCEHEEDFYE